MKKILLSLAGALTLLLCSCASQTPSGVNTLATPNIPSGSPVSEQQYSIASKQGDIVSTETLHRSESYAMRERSYQLPNGDSFSMRRFALEDKAAEPVRYQFKVGGKAGSYRYYDPVSGEWEVKLLDGALPKCNVYITIDGSDILLVPPLAYTEIENGTIRSVPECDGSVSVSRYKGAFYFEYEIPLRESVYADCFVLRSDAQLIDWTNEIMLNIWRGYDMAGENRFCLDGYYFTSPSDYLPTGRGCYWKTPGAYIPIAFAGTGGSRAADDLGIIMLDMLRGNINEEGYFTSLPESRWLQSDYGIPSGFYDTRFNTDIFQAYLIASRKFEIPVFLEAAVRYADFFTRHAESNHFSIPFKQFEGWLVCDYAHPAKSVKTHVSLNHQVAEICFLYRLSEVTGEQKYADLAFTLLQGIRYTGDAWIRPDGDLHYAYLPDGSFGLPDYPYLTYNDLFELRRILSSRTGSVEQPVQNLMDAKKEWMDAKGITAYRK